MEIKENKPSPSEIFCANALKETFLPDNIWTVGDDEGRHNLPDLYTEDKQIGIEIVQMEQDCDLDVKYVWDEMEKIIMIMKKQKNFATKNILFAMN